LDTKRGSKTEKYKKHRNEEAINKEDVEGNCDWKGKSRLRQKRRSRASFVESHSRRTVSIVSDVKVGLAKPALNLKGLCSCVVLACAYLK
jgi:hypothetical protein